MRSTTLATTCSLAICSGALAANITGVTDFAQDRLTWNNYCAPTNGANLAYFYGQTYSSLSGANTSVDADNTIIDMATRMGTTNSGGTTVNGLVSGLDGYLEDNWDSTTGGTDWNTQYLDGATLGGAALLTAVDNALTNGDGVILLIAWKAGLPIDAAYQTPDGYDGSTGVTDPMGHAVALTGTLLGPNPIIDINDPANNAGTHSFASENAMFGITVNANDWTLNAPMGGATATVYGAVTTSIPSPGALPLLGLAFVARRRR